MHIFEGTPDAARTLVLPFPFSHSFSLEDASGYWKNNCQERSKSERTRASGKRTIGCLRVRFVIIAFA